MVFPDRELTEGPEGLHEWGARRLLHPSGRLWLAGTWSNDDLVIAQAPHGVIVIMGVCSITSGQLSDCLNAASPRERLADLSRRAAGSFYVLASVNGVTWAHGTTSGVCQLFHGRRNAVGAISNSASMLADFIGSALSTSGVAAHLLAPSPPWPLDQVTIWDGVAAVDCDVAVTLSAGGEISFEQRWSAPDAVLGAREAADLLAEAIDNAVAVRADRSASLSCDLSGGLDSTSVAFVAASRDVDLTTFSEGSKDPAHDDWMWAQRAAGAMRGRNVVVDLEDAAVDFDPAPPSVFDAEGPFAWQRARAKISASATRAAQVGSRDHLTGHGGDEVFDVGPANDHSAFQAGALRYARLSTSSRLNRRWTTARHLRLLTDRTSYSQWLAGAGGQDLRQDLASSAPGTSVWGPQPLLAPWMTDDAEATVRSMLTKTSESMEALSPWRAQHALLSGARQCGAAMRRCDQITREAGVRWHAPLLDDRVIEVEMATSFGARVSSGTYKPTLAAAMVGRVPQELLDRPSKADFSRDMYVALRRNRAEMLGWCDELRLGGLGLVDSGALRASILGNHPTPPSMIQLFTTLAAESWLRSVPALGRAHEGVRP